MIDDCSEDNFHTYSVIKSKRESFRDPIWPTSARPSTFLPIDFPPYPSRSPMCQERARLEYVPRLLPMDIRICHIHTYVGIYIRSSLQCLRRCGILLPTNKCISFYPQQVWSEKPRNAVCIEYSYKSTIFRWTYGCHR